jgi:hypothetical protein
VQNVIYSSWKASDDETEIVAINMGVGTAPGQDDVYPFSSVGKLTRAYSVSTRLKPDITYITTLLVTNEAGLTTTISSDGFVVDFTPPEIIISIETEPPGPLMASGIIHVSWEASDPESGMSSEPMYVGIGTAPNSDNVVPFVEQRDPYFSSPMINYTHGSRYFVTIRATNKVEMRASSWNDGLLCDNQPPYHERARVNDGPGSNDIDFQVLPQAAATWFGFIDIPAGIDRYYCSLLEGNEMVGWVDAGKNLEARFDATLVNGGFYTTMVFAVDAVGNWVNVSSDGFMFDNTPPMLSSVYISGQLITGESNQVYISSTQAITVEWDSFMDQESGIKEYEVSIGSQRVSQGEYGVPGEDDVVRIKNPVQEQSIQMATASVSLTHDTTYFGVVHALNRAGLRTMAPVDGFMVTVDVTPPVIEFDYSFPGSGRFLPNGTSLTAVWSMFDTISGVIASSYAVGSYRGGRNLVDLTEVSLEESTEPNGNIKITSDIETTDGLTYYWLVTATNGADSSSTITGDGILIDGTPPSLLYVTDTAGPLSTEDRAFVSATSGLACLWLFSDQQSGINKYDIAIAEIQGDCGQPDTCMLDAGSALWWNRQCGDMTNECAFVPAGKYGFETGFESAGTSTRKLYAPEEMGLVHNNTYFCAVRASNGAGLTSVQQSNGFTFDATVAQCASVRDGLQADADFLNSLSLILGSWECDDAESGIASFSWTAINLATGVAYFPFVFVGPMDRVSRTDMTTISNGDAVAIRVQVSPITKYFIHARRNSG